MTFFDLLSLMSGIGLFTAIIAGKDHGYWGVASGFIIGAIVAVAFIVGWRVAGKWFLRRFNLADSNAKGLNLILSWLMLLVAVGWIAASGFSGALITKWFVQMWQ